MRNCQQTKCGYLGTLFCPICSECKAEPNVVDENCVSCHNCQYDEGYIRGNIPQEQQKDNELILIKI